MSISERIQANFNNYICQIENGLGRKLNNAEIEIAEENFNNKTSVSGMVYYFQYES